MPVREGLRRRHRQSLRVLNTAQTRFHRGKSGLHEHDKKARHQRPGELDRDLVLAYMVGNVG